MLAAGTLAPHVRRSHAWTVLLDFRPQLPSLKKLEGTRGPCERSGLLIAFLRRGCSITTHCLPFSTPGPRSNVRYFSLNSVDLPLTSGAPGPSSCKVVAGANATAVRGVDAQTSARRAPQADGSIPAAGTDRACRSDGHPGHRPVGRLPADRPT